MRMVSIGVGILLVFSVGGAAAGDPTCQSPGLKIAMTPGELTATPEMWFYEQYAHQYQDPKAAVRQKAEFRTAQRQRRMAALRWFGFSNARPTAAPDPIHGTYSPGWAANGHYPFRWSGSSPAVVVIRTERSRSTY